MYGRPVISISVQHNRTCFDTESLLTESLLHMQESCHRLHTSSIPGDSVYINTGSRHFSVFTSEVKLEECPLKIFELI